MNYFLKLTVIVLLAAGAFALSRTNNASFAARVSAQASPTPPALPAPAPFDQAAAIAKLKEQIKGRENELAPAVFKNIQTMKNTPAGRLLSVMEMGFTKS